MPQKKKTSKKKRSAQAKPAKKTSPRVLKKSTYQSFRLAKSIKYTGRALPSGWQLLRQATQVIWQHKKVLGGILLVYGLLQIILVQGILASNVAEVKEVIDESIDGPTATFAMLTYMVGSFGQTANAESSVYQSMLFVICSLAFIWALRQVLADKTIRIRDGFYKGMYPLIPFVLVFAVIGLQTIPALIGAWLYSVIIANGIAVVFAEQLFWLVIFLLFLLLSAYMICSSLFALYIVTLPDVAPMRALRSARELVRYRRLSIARKFLMLAVVLVIAVATVMVPVIMVAAALAPIVFYMLSVVIVGFLHAYVYTLYRELLIDDEAQ